MIRRPPRSTLDRSSAASDVYKRQIVKYVITVYEDIKSQDASDFTYEFYKRYKNNLDIESSFVEALRILSLIHISEPTRPY